MKSYVIALAMSVAIAGWMLAGQFSEPEQEATTRSAAATAPSRMTVETRSQSARQVERQIVAQGQVEPDRVVTIRAETAGRIATVAAVEGAVAQVGEALAQVEMNARLAKLSKAKALVRERDRAYVSAQKLGAKGYQSQRRLDELFSSLQAARADLADMELEIDNTTMRAPFTGIIEKRWVEVGDYVAVNGQIATIVDNDPVVVSVQVAQQDIGRVSKGDAARVSFASGQKAAGHIRFIAPRAEEGTRTFRVEIEVPNADGLIPSGISAQASIPTGTVSAHFVSPALLTLDAAGTVGVKTVNTDGIVKFHAVRIVTSGAAGVWVSGLPDEARIITVGQGFVRDGEVVSIQPATPDVGVHHQSGQVAMLSDGLRRP